MAMPAPYLLMMQGNPIHGLCQVDSKVDSMRGNSTNAFNRGKQLAQIKTDYGEALQKLLNFSRPTE